MLKKANLVANILSLGIRLLLFYLRRRKHTGVNSTKYPSTMFTSTFSSDCGQRGMHICRTMSSPQELCHSSCTSWSTLGAPCLGWSSTACSISINIRSKMYARQFLFTPYTYLSLWNLARKSFANLNTAKNSNLSRAMELRQASTPFSLYRWAATDMVCDVSPFVWSN